MFLLGCNKDTVIKMENEIKPVDTNEKTTEKKKRESPWGAIGALAGAMAVVVAAIALFISYESDEEKRYKELIKLYESESFRTAFREEIDYWYRIEYREKVKKIMKILATGKGFRKLQELTLGCINKDKELRQWFRELLAFYNDVAIDINQKRVEQVEACEHFGFEILEFWRWYSDALKEIGKSEGNDYYKNLESANHRCEKLRRENNYEYRKPPTRYLNP